MESSEENAFTAGASSPPQRVKYLFLSFLPSFLRPPFSPLSPASVTGVAEGSPSVKEAHRGPMRTVRLCVRPHAWMCASAAYRKKSCCVSLSFKCVFGVSVDSL